MKLKVVNQIDICRNICGRDKCVDLKNHECVRIDGAKVQRDTDQKVVDRLTEALEKIASCESHATGDVVDIARKALEV